MRQQVFEFTLTGALIGVLSVIAFSAIMFLWNQITAFNDSGARLAAMMFAPFALIAAVIPAFARFMLRRICSGFRASPRANMLAAFVVIWLISELTLFAIRTLGNATSAMPWAFHLLLAGYAVAGAFFSTGETPSDDQSIAP